jgi:thiol:disulfide interchange protein
MKTISPVSSLIISFVLAIVILPGRLHAGNASNLPPIYDTTAKGTNQIADALVAAKKDGRRVLLEFGANWCIWCHRLHDLCETDPDIAEKLKSGYVVVLIDVNGSHNSDVVAKYGQPTRFGLPVIVVLDADGKQLVTENTGELEEGNGHSPQKVLAFLTKWAPVVEQKQQ